MSESITPPNRAPLPSVLPTEPLLLMGAGPVPIPYEVARANGVIINHLGQMMNDILEAVKDMSRYAFQTRADKVLGVAGPASAAMEMAMANLCWPGRRVLSLVNGWFSARLAEMAVGVGAEVTRIESEVAQPISADRIKQQLAQGTYDVVTLVQGETSCGVLNVELPEIVKLAKEHGALVIVDAVCTLTTMPLQVDDWGIDVAITGGQKGLSSIPGVSLIVFSEQAWKLVEQRPGPRPHWCLDALRAQRFWGDHQYHYTAPVPGILAMYEALRLICEETLEKRFERHLHSSRALQAGIEAMGLDLFVKIPHRLNSVVAIRVPDGIDDASVRSHMARTYGVEIAGAFGLDIVRIGQMGDQCRPHNLFKTLYALGRSFQHEGARIHVATGMTTLEDELTVGLGAYAEQ
jgi:alanine-glyoxylate transaminase/serine-glyoxylate transaminase/serine-pyruvate transaminase